MSCDHVYKARLAHIGATYESIFRLAVIGTLLYIRITYNKTCILDQRLFHITKELFRREDSKKIMAI
jgi:hypothetical protein